MRAFFGLDARRSTCGRALVENRRNRLYLLGNEMTEYQNTRRAFSVYGGYSRRLKNGLVRRLNVGVAHHNSRLSAVTNPILPSSIPDNRKLIYPLGRIEIVDHAFENISNSNQTDRTEDSLVGTRLTARLGCSERTLGADRGSLIYATSFNRGFDSLNKTHRCFRLCEWAYGIRAQRKFCSSKSALVTT
jgi:hypothetical protein